jgi:uncharacterized membrane protein YfcA
VTGLSEILRVAFAILLVLSGLYMLARPTRARAAQVERHRSELADRLARGTDAYFEELRSLEAYAPRPRSRGVTQLLGALIVLIGALQLLIPIIR